MQIKSKANISNTVDMPPASAAHISINPDRDLGLGLLLGNDYESKKKKLQQELQLDYKQHAAKKKDLKLSEPRPQPQGLSLPIDEKTSVQEKLREERKKEYNLFLQEKAKTGRLKRSIPPVTSKPGQFQASDMACISSPASPPPILNTHTNIGLPRPTSRRDVATLTELVDNGRSSGTLGPGRRGRRRWKIHRRKELYSSEDESITDREDELEFRHRRRRDRYTPEPEYREERRTRQHRANRAPADMKEVEPPGVHDQNSKEWALKSDLQMPDSMRTAARSRPATSKDKAEFATGLMIGAIEEQTASQMRKERYKQELLTQIAEQQRNKMREKKLELRVAATGATDPEKQPDRIKQFGAVNRQYDSLRRDVPYKLGVDLEAVRKDPNPRPKDDKPTEDTKAGKSHVDYSTALSQLTGKTEDYFNEDYHRDFSNMLGEVANPRVADVPLPAPPTVTNNYNTPYDAAYYYYGTRNPLDPSPPYNHNDLPGRLQQSGNFHSPPQRPPPPRPSGRIEATDQHRASPLDVGDFPAEKSKQRRESALCYQEALKQQIKEREERKRREKEEKEQYDAKLEAEMMAYNPFGRSGGGAPIKDQKGNLVSDLNQMHRTNEESYRNPAFRNSGQTQSFLMTNRHTPGVEARTPVTHRISGFSDQPTPQQLHMKDQYKADLKRQIEANKQKLIEETERARLEEEKEERRLADQRASMQRYYEEEQSNQREIDHRLKKQNWIPEPETRQQEEEKREVRREEEIEKKVPESTRGRKENRAQLSYEREPSPPIPTLQRRQTHLLASRPSSVVSQLSTRTERSVSAPHSRPVLAKTPQLQDGQQEVLRELSALRRHLRKEQRQLEAQLGQTDQQESHYTPPNRPRGQRPRVDVFESTHKPTTRSPSSDATLNMQNIREFNHLKYRDTASREEVRHVFPDPPTDAQSLDIQQQALLREQQRKLRLMKREEEEHDFLDQKPHHYHPRNKPEPRDSILPSETSFIDVHSGDAREEQERHRPAPRRRRDYDEVSVSADQRDCNVQPDAQSVQSEKSLSPESKVRAHNQQQRITRQDSGDRNGRSEWPSGDELDVLSLRSALERRVSTETVTTEAWLRPGMSDTVKRSGCRERLSGGRDAAPWLTHRVT